MKQFAKTLLILAMASPLASLANVDSALIAKGKAKATACGACHGADGNSAIATWPKLAGQNAKYLLKQLNAFKQGAKGPRNNAIMAGQVASLSEQDLKAVSAYYASLKMSEGKTAKQYVKLGQALYRGGDLKDKIPACAACHGPQGKGNAEAGFPAIAGQWADYSIAQLKAYRDGSRSTGVMMSAIAKNMSDKQMTAVAHYIAGLH